MKSKRQTRTCVEKTVLLLRYKNLYAVRQRPKQGLLGGLWEFPTFEEILTWEEVMEKMRALSPVTVTDIGRSKHVFTHLEWHMQGYLVECTTEIQILYGQPARRFYLILQSPQRLAFTENSYNPKIFPVCRILIVCFV